MYWLVCIYTIHIMGYIHFSKQFYFMGQNSGSTFRILNTEVSTPNSESHNAISGVILEGDLGEKVSLSWLTSPYLELREK